MIVEHAVSAASTAVAPEGAFIRTLDGEKLYLEHFLPPGKPRAVILFVHGYSTHSGPYRGLAQQLASQGFVVTLFDVRGHGRSSGRRGFVRAFSDYGRDLALMIAEARAGHGRLPVVIVAHSHGGLIALDYLLGTPDHGVAGVVAGAPFLGLKMKVPAYKLALSSPLSRLWPTLAMHNEIKSEEVLRNETYRRAFDGEDKLIFHTATARWFTESRAAQARVLAGAAAFSVPMCVQIPGDDRLVDADTTRAFVSRLPSELVEARTYPDLYHELFIDTGCEPVVADLASWIHRVSSRPEAR
jgi:alpha-beta hydrolase superfamily lysophospholipase